MKAVTSKMTRPLPHHAILEACDNSGAKKLKLFGVKTQKTTKKRMETAGIGDYCMASVVEGKPDIRKQVVQVVIVRQKKEFRRPDGTRISFSDNAAVVVKDEMGNPKGTLIKGPIPKEVSVRWPALAKLAKIIV